MPSPTDVSDLVASAAAESPDRLALVEVGGRSLTWERLEDEVARVAHGLNRLHVVGGHRVMLVLGNRLEFVTTYLGTLRAHAVSVPVNPRTEPYDLARMIADSGSRLIVADATTVASAREAVAMVQAALAGSPVPGARELEPELLARAKDPHVVVVGEGADGETTYADLVSGPPQAFAPIADPERLAVLLYTAGTSGRPRAAMLTHRALLANIEQVADTDPPMMHGDDVVLGVLPLFHVYGLNAVLGSVLRHRAKLVLVDHFDPEGTLDLIDDEAISVVPVAPAVFGHWVGRDQLKERLGPVRLVLSGSAVLAGEVMERFTAETGLEVHQGYGLTEAAPVVTTTMRGAPSVPGSVGRPLTGVEVRLVDEHTGHLEGDDPGEIQVRGANLFSGYWPDGADAPGEDGWWSTGDVGYHDASGDLFLVDRVRDMLVVSGFNVYPSEVEDVIAEVEGVSSAAVIGVEDSTTGQAVVAYVVPDGTDRDADEVAAAVRTHVETRLARFKRPSRIEVVDALPTTVTGRVEKGRLRGIERRRALGLLE
ncbi:class I adenylate-forming enzyme family protein [Nocardioides daphniae]|uniref:AMP-dependent synthetase n=1 Tax=Nocardioides daphniae TaxID=402297 RepID=A0A4P7UDE4_9ACTN|nr:class I adenylate-forming enzyme family protein [Nocardioides daphniae]QCC78260.1 AMP-dependent synthetase [Nocardioides daphniae]GGD20384.1 long-chain acyl-CoA synthetase [Nocardioides daphniae]